MNKLITKLLFATIAMAGFTACSQDLTEEQKKIPNILPNSLQPTAQRPAQEPNT